MRELLHQLNKALSCIRAEQCIGRNFHIVKEKLGCVLRVHPDFVENASAAETFEVICLDNEERFGMLTFAACIGHNDNEVRRTAICDEGFRAINHPAITVLLGIGLDVL